MIKTLRQLITKVIVSWQTFMLFLDIVQAESRAVTKHKILLEVYLKIIAIYIAKLKMCSS